MPTYGTATDYAAIARAREAIRAHYIRRGVPDTKLDEAVRKFVSKNGYRAPIVH